MKELTMNTIPSQLENAQQLGLITTSPIAALWRGKSNFDFSQKWEPSDIPLIRRQV